MAPLETQIKMITCPKCNCIPTSKSGRIGSRQRYLCKPCSLNFTVGRAAKILKSEKMVIALELYLCGFSYREIGSFLTVSHVTIMNWINTHKIYRGQSIQKPSVFKIVSNADLLPLVETICQQDQPRILILAIRDKYFVYST